MIITIEPGLKVNVPAASDFLVRVATAFSAGELALPGTVVALEYQKFDGTAGEIAGTIDDTDLVFPIVPGQFTSGEWTINPRALVSGYVRRWPSPAILVVGAPLVQVVDCGC